MAWWLALGRCKGDAMRRRALLLACTVLAVGGCGGGVASTTGRTLADPGSPSFFSLPATTTHTVTVWSWSGHRAGRFATGPVAQCCTTVAASPDGREFEIADQHGAEVVGAAGRRVGQVAVSGTWADDDQHVCALKPTEPGSNWKSTAGRLLLEDGSNGHSRVVATIPGAYGDHLSSGVAWCSVKHDEAVIFFNLMGSVQRTEVVRLSTGAVLQPSWEHAPVADWIAVSGDGRYVAAIGRRAQGEVVDAASGKIIKDVPIQPDGISWDGHVVVGLDASTSQEEAVDWRTKQVLWESGFSYPKCPCRVPNVTIAAQPGADAVAVVVTNTPSITPPTGALWLVTTTARPVLLDAKVQEGAV